MKAFLISIPHSGERVPMETPWLHGLPEPVLMCDVDRYVDRLYKPVVEQLHIPHVVTEWHRCVVDLNRLPGDVDPESVEGSDNPPGKFWNGLIWVRTTRGNKLLPKPISAELHKNLVRDYFQPFHDRVQAIYADFRKAGAKRIYHIDAHSMPSMGTKSHKDPGQRRADIVISDCEGTSCSAEFKELVIGAYKNAGLGVAYNWPYGGGRVTQTYGKPALGQDTIQVEINRALYMDEESKAYLPDKAANLIAQLSNAIAEVQSRLPDIK